MQIITLLKTAALTILPSSYLNQLASQVISQILATPVTLTQTEQISKLTSLQTSLSTISSNCASSQASQEKYQICVENMYLTFNQVDGISQNSASGVSTIDSSFVSLTESIGDILTAYALPNEDPVEYSGSLLYLKSQKITDKLLINYLGISQRLLATSSSSSSSIYDASFKTYTNNLYSNYASFKDYAANVANYTNNTQMTTVFPVINPSIKTSFSGSAYIIPSQAAHFFKNIEPKRNLTCFSKSKSTSKWTTTDCSTYLSNKTQEIQCFCTELSPTTVVQDISSLFTNNKNLATAFSSDGLANISNFTNFYLYVVFWVLSAQTLGLIVLVIKGRILDAASIDLLCDKRSQTELNSILSAQVIPLQSTPVAQNNIIYTKNQSIEADQLHLSSPSIKINPDQVSAERDIGILDPKKTNLFLNNEDITKQSIKSKSSLASILPKENNQNEGLDLEHNNCESSDEKNHQTLQNESEKSLKSDEQIKGLSTLKEGDNLDRSLAKIKRDSKVEQIAGQSNNNNNNSQEPKNLSLIDRYPNSVVIAIVSKLVSTLLGKTGILKKLGALFTFLVITFYLYLILSIQSGSPYHESNSFVWSYVAFLIMDVVIVQTVTAIVFSFIAQKVIRQDSNHGGFFFKAFDFLKLNIILTSLLNFSK